MSNNKEKRYVVTVDFYGYADTDEEAIETAKEIAATIDQLADNKCAVVSVVEQPPGKLGNRHVYGREQE